MGKAKHDNIMRMHEHPFIALAAAIAQVVPVVVVVSQGSTACSDAQPLIWTSISLAWPRQTK